jgi:hypothetical protein
MTDDQRQAQNTDQCIWRQPPGDFYSDAIYVTQQGAIAIDCGGLVIVLPLRRWHQIAKEQLEREAK